MSECQRPRCRRPVARREYCEGCYRKRVKAGMYRIVPRARLLGHLDALRAQHWTWHQIAAAAGCSPATVHGLHCGRCQSARSDTAHRILSIPLRPQATRRAVDATGTRRRVQALGVMGWPASVIATRCGVARATLSTAIHNGRLSASLAARVAAVYDELWDTQGPSLVAAGKARQLGYVGAGAWDDETIDDPAAVPQGAGWEPGAADPTEVAWLERCGVTDERIAERLGVQRDTVGYLRRKARAA